MRRALTIVLIGEIICSTTVAQRVKLLAQSGPGNDAHWMSAAKNGFGTSNSLRSKVWFTLAQGVLTEVYYPSLDLPNVQTLQLIIVDGGRVQTEIEDTIHQTEVIDDRSLSFRQINTARNGNYKIVKSYITDPTANTLLMQIEFQSRSPVHVYVYYDPSLNNSGLHDTGWTDGQALFATDGDKTSALMSSPGFNHGVDGGLIASNGFLGINDGLTELRRSTIGNSFTHYTRAEDGNLVQFAELSSLSNSAFAQTTTRGAGFHKANCTLALGFGRSAAEALNSARASLDLGFVAVQHQYQRGWRNFVEQLPHVDESYQRQFNIAAMSLRAMEDKTYRGATIASPSIPWGGGASANEPTTSGYHAVWSRDLYHVATALLALGDFAGANRSLNYLFEHQQKSDGSFPQNSRVTGTPIGNGVQMDQVALPIVLAYQLGRKDRVTWLTHIKPAADFIVRNGPATGQDRWEEKPGYSPSTIAAEIAGLVCAAYIARLNRDRVSERTYLKFADEWVQSIERWTATSTGLYSGGNYYLRISENNNPNDGAKIEINSGGGIYDEREIVDAGFLELVRLGIRRPDDPLIANSLKVVDALIKRRTPNGDCWYRYNHDAYGEQPNGDSYDGQNGVGRLWTLLTGERGEFELARGNKQLAAKYLTAMMRFANDGSMIPEQVWDREDAAKSDFRIGEGTGSATPLAWSMAQFIRLAMNLKHGRIVERPAVVARRYSLR